MVNSKSLLTLTLVFFSIFFFYSCKNETALKEELKKPQIQNLFEYLKTSETGVDFNNLIRDTQDFQIFNYEYAYNGGGVAIGDINNDNLPDLYFSGTFVGNKLYLNQGNLKFKDITKEAGVDGGIGYKTGITMVDVNDDGFLDIYVCKSGNFPSDSLRTNLLYINKGNLKFVEEAASYGLNDKSFSTQAYWSDIDVDGDVDMYLVNHPIGWGNQNKLNLQQDAKRNITPIRDTARYQVSDRLYINENGKFKDKTKEFGLDNKAFGLSAMIADYNNDGYPDIYVANDYIQPDHFYINKGGKYFEDKVNDYFQNLTMSSMGSDAFDINNDGELDIYVNDMMPEGYVRLKENINLIKNYDSHLLAKKYNYHDQFRYNAMHIKSENGKFENRAFLTNTSSTDWSWTVLGEDFDANGNNDLFITNGYLKDVVNMDYTKYTLDSLRRFVPQDKQYGEWKSRVPEAKLRNYFYANNGSLEFDNTSSVWCDGRKSFSNGAAYADLDNDGDLDIIVNNINDAAFVMKNTLSEKEKSLNYVSIKLISNTKNKAGYGSEITAELASGKKIKKLFNPFRGYMSSQDQRCYFGSKEKINNIIVKWPNSGYEVFSVEKNGDIKLEQGKGKLYKFKTESVTPIFTKTQTNVNHIENEFVDFKAEPLLNMKSSTEGPTITAADFDNDGNEDVYIGGALNQSRGIYKIQNNSLIKISNPVFDTETIYEDVASLSIDFDKDGDKDLVVASGGYQFEENSPQYAVRLYINDGKGNFSRDKNVMPEYKTNANSICSADFDGDGDEDIFIGGGALPKTYPLSDKSLYLRNDKGKFTLDNSLLPDEGKLTIIKDCIATDMNNDGTIDLVFAGDYSTIKILANKNKKFVDETESFGLSNSDGLWQDILIEDINGDGKKDIIAGNLGLNSFFKATDKNPLTVFEGDLDKNGEREAIICMYFKEGLRPIHTLDKLLTQCTKLRKKFLRYSTFANAKIEDIFESEALKKCKMYYAHTLESSIFINQNGKFVRQTLPQEAQVSMVKDMSMVNKDGQKYLIVLGNFWDTDFEFGKYDASHGSVFKIDAKGNFTLVKNSGLDAHNNARELKIINSKSGKKSILVGNNNGAAELYNL